MSMHFNHCVGIATVVVLGFTGTSRAACIPTDSPQPANQDAVARVLESQPSCPRDALEFRNLLKSAGARLEPTMVNFVGYHNPDPGAFFVFEIVSGTVRPATGGGGRGTATPIAIERGDLVFGHFMTAATNRLVLNRSDLVIELIAWDPVKQFFNFYEMTRETPSRAEWFYRGDSSDILDDIALMHRQPAPSQPKFGERLRCSGCHVNGGLVQKELVAPHNDWWSRARPLPLGGLKPDSSVAAIMAELVDAGELAKVVQATSQRLADSPGYRKALAARTMQERLRPLFCPVEVNIESDAPAFDDKKPTVTIPSGFFADTRLASVEISVSRADYDAALRKLNSHLPDSPPRADADHGWLTPVKAHSDKVAVDALVTQGVIDREFVADVLGVDVANPVFSKQRCGLLRLVPKHAGENFGSEFLGNLRGASQPGAVELLSNLTDPQRTAAFHEDHARRFLANCQGRAAAPEHVLEWVRLLAQRREEVKASEISKNPRGQILEFPGRIVFPSVKPEASPGRLALNTACQVQ